jgi:hypothetical protein
MGATRCCHRWRLVAPKSRRARFFCVGVRPSIFIEKERTMRPEQLAMLANILKKTQPMRSTEIEHRRLDRLRTTPVDAKPAMDNLAAQIIAAGECARRGGHVVQPPPPGSLASQIITAAATARAGGPELARPTGLAAQIVEAGKRRRGEI